MDYIDGQALYKTSAPWRGSLEETGDIENTLVKITDPHGTYSLIYLNVSTKNDSIGLA